MGIGPNVKLSRPDKAGVNLIKVSCRRASPQPWTAQRVRVGCSALLGLPGVDSIKLTNNIRIVEPLASALGIVWVE